MMDLKIQLHSLQKGHLSMQSYVDQKRYVADHLRLIGSSIFDADLRVYILYGLNIEYESLVVSLNARSDAVPFFELTGLLLTHEQCFQKHTIAAAGTTPHSAFPVVDLCYIWCIWLATS
jgi:hypothetical protein